MTLPLPDPQEPAEVLLPPPPPWRASSRRQHPGVPAWSAPSGGPPAVHASSLPENVTPEWAFGDADGSGVRVAILDSGVDPGHPMVGSVDVSMAVEFTSAGDATVVPSEPGDTAGHGTACAGIIRSLAPRCTLASVRVLTAGMQGGGPALLAGLRWAIDEGYDVINLSLSTSKPLLRTELAALCDLAYFRRSLICASAHNSPLISYPWQFGAVISVASVDKQPDPQAPAMHYYNASPPVEFFAPGVGLQVAWAGGSTIKATGNSFATPYLAGVCAQLLSKHPDLTPFQVKSVLYLTSANVGVKHAG